MLFNSPEFIFLFLPAAVCLHFTLARWGKTAAAAGTSISSLIFYAWWNPPLVVLPIASVVANYWVAMRMTAAPGVIARRWFILGICANLVALGYFKYADFVLTIIDGRARPLPSIPLAISFVTFVQIAFLYDAYRRRVELDWRTYPLFVLYFPHLIAGPIVRWSNLGRQLSDAQRYHVDWDNIALGLTIFVFGLVKKILIADPLAPFVATVFDAAARGDPITAVAGWCGSFAFAAQIYFDFAGYSEMAIGLGLLFNFRLPINFAAPLRAVTMFDLWRRWHITLSTLVRDLVYVPLSRGDTGTARRAFNLMLTMVLIGFWHGAGWTFIVWGAYNGALLLINQFWHWLRGTTGRGTLVGRVLGWALTFTAFSAGAAFFRGADITAAWRIWQAMAGFGHALPASSELDQWTIRSGYVSGEFLATWFGAYWSLPAMLWTLGAVLIIVLVPDTLEITGYKVGDPPTKWRRNAGVLAWRPSAITLCAMVAAFVTVFAQIGRVKDFVYYQF